MKYFLLGAAGALTLEILNLWAARNEVDLEEFRRRLRSPIRWGMFVGMVLASGFLTWVAYSQSEAEPMNLALVSTGAAARTLLREAPRAAAAPPPGEHLGSRKQWVRDILG